MAWGVVAGVAGSLLGGALASRGAQKAGDAAAAAQREAGQLAAQASAFRPVGMTTRFGTSTFDVTTDPNTGLPVLTSAGYEASPEIRALQDRLSALYGTSLGQAEQAQALGAPLGQAAQGLFGLGQQYLAQSPEQARQQYMSEQMALLDPIRQREEQRLGASLFGRGRVGLNVGDRGQPELAALASARRTQDLQLAAEAERAAQQRAQFGAGLFGTGGGLLGDMYGLQTSALSPFQTQFGVQSALEQAALQPLEIGSNLGGRAINTAGANALLQGGLGAAQTQAQGRMVGPALLANAVSQPNYGDLFSRLMGQGSMPSYPSFGGLQSAFSQTGLGSSGFGSGLAYGRQDLGQYL